MSIASAIAIRAGLHEAAWSVSDLWIASVGVGGSFTQADIAAIADGVREATEIEHDILAATMNDHFTGGEPRHPVQYWRDLPSDAV